MWGERDGVGDGFIPCEKFQNSTCRKVGIENPGEMG